MATVKDKLAPSVIKKDVLREPVRVTFEAPQTLALDDGIVKVEIDSPQINPDFVAALSEGRSLTIAAASGNLSADDLDNLRQALDDNELLIDPRLNSVTIRSEVAEHYILNLLDRWVDDIYYDGLWQPLLERKDSTNLVYGWAVENYHYTQSVDEHLGTAIHKARKPEVARKFTHHISEEWDHPHLFLASAKRIAESAGSVEAAEHSSPMGATRSITLLLKRAAGAHPFVYKACAATLERTASLLQETRDFYRQVTELHGLPPDVLQPIVLHAETDGEYGHLNSLAEFRKLYPTLPPEVVQQAAEYARTFVDLLYVWQREIAQRYENFPVGQGAVGLTEKQRPQKPEA